MVHTKHFENTRAKTQNYYLASKKRRTKRIGYREMNIILSAWAVALVLFWAVAVMYIVDHAHPL